MATSLSMIKFTMRKIKTLLIILLIIFSFILNSELFQSYLTSFVSEYNFIQVTPTEANVEALPKYLNELSESINIPFFVVDVENSLLEFSSVNIYASESAYKKITEENKITAGVFEGAILGKTKVTLNNLVDYNISDIPVKLYFYAENHEYKLIHQKINERYVTGYIHKDSSVGEKTFSMCLWCVFGAFYLLFTILDLQFRKKELFLKISLGCPKSRIIFIECCKDIFSLIFISVGLRLILKELFYTDFNIKFYYIIIIVSGLMNLFVYLFVYRINYKEILYGGNIGESTVTNCYIVKITSMLLTIFVLSMNFALLAVNVVPLANTKYIKKYNNYEFAELSATQKEIEDLSPYYNNLSIEGFKNKSAIISVKYEYFGKEGRDFIFSNDISFLLDSKIASNYNNKKVLIVFPYDINNELGSSTEILNCVYRCIKNITGINIKNIDVDILYSKTFFKAIYFDLQDKENAQLGVGVSTNPVFIYCNTDKLNLADGFDINLSESLCRYTLFKPHFLDSQFTFLNEEEINLVKKEAHAVFNYNKATLLKTVALSIVIVVTQLFIDVSLIATLIRVEYSANARELALKKILGYSVFEKNKSLILLNIYSSLIGIMTAIIIFILLDIELKVFAVLCGVLIMIFEMVILIISIRKFERRNTIKILKGGAL